MSEECEGVATTRLRSLQFGVRARLGRPQGPSDLGTVHDEVHNAWVDFHDFPLR